MFYAPFKGLSERPGCGVVEQNGFYSGGENNSFIFLLKPQSFQSRRSFMQAAQPNF